MSQQSKQVISYGKDPTRGEVTIAFFDPNETGWKSRIGVFSTSVRNGPSSINCAESIIHAICDKNNLHWKDVIFCDLQTHVGYRNRIRGFYNLEVLRLSNEPYIAYGKPTLSGQAEEWITAECPAIVFETFKDIIGPFLGLDEVINRSRECYRDQSDQYMVDEMAWAVDWIARNKKYEVEYLQKNRTRIYTPEQAYKMGYRFAPGFHHDDFPELKEGDEAIVVDLRNSHLLGQHNMAQEGASVFKTPQPRSIWYKKQWPQF